MAKKTKKRRQVRTIPGHRVKFGGQSERLEKTVGRSPKRRTAKRKVRPARTPTTAAQASTRSSRRPRRRPKTPKPSEPENKDKPSEPEKKDKPSEPEKKDKEDKPKKHQCPEAFKEWLTETIKKGVNGIREEFKQIRSYTPAEFSADAFNMNIQKNRYKDVICMDQTRVKLTGDTDNDYIHASHVRTDGQLQFICAQGPMDSTTTDFWRMVLELNCGIIIMLCDVYENGKPKCNQYWPKDTGNCQKVGSIFLTTKSINQVALPQNQTITITDICALNLSLSEVKYVQHYWWTSWPDKSIPATSRPILMMIEKAMVEAKGRTVIVHCSAGIGRTGTLVALYMCVERLNHNQLLDVPSVLRELRDQRLHSVQTESQYLFIYRTLIEYFEDTDQFPTSTQLDQLLQDFNNGGGGAAPY